MEKREKILPLNNEIEANLLEAVLTERGFPYVIKKYHDSALSNIFQPELGWGHLNAPPEYWDQILEIYQDIVDSAGRTDIGPQEVDEHPERP